METLLIIGRIFFGGFFIYNGLNHLLKNEMLSEYAQSKKVPFPMFSVIVSGLLILFGGLGVLFWLYVKLSLYFIVLFLVVISFKMHDFWADKDLMTKNNNLVNFTKNLALIGASLVLIALL